MKEEKFDQNKYIQKYHKEHYERIEFRCKPEEKKELVRRAEEAGLPLSRYLIKKGLED